MNVHKPKITKLYCHCVNCMNAYKAWFDKKEMKLPVPHKENKHNVL